MSSVESTTLGISSTRGGRPSSTGARGGRGRGRGRGSFRFPPPTSTDVGGVGATAGNADAHSHSSQPANAESRRKPPRKANARRSFTSVSSSGPIADTESQPKQSLEKELPPHIAGAAVDAESLVSRVRELAIHAHAHSSSVESRFTMSRDWADEEDDPDSLPDLDDWAKPKPGDANPPQQEPTIAEVTSSKNVEDGPANTEGPIDSTGLDSTKPVTESHGIVDSGTKVVTESTSTTASIPEKANEPPSQAETPSLPSPDEKRSSLHGKNPSEKTGRGGSRPKNNRQPNNRGHHSRIVDLPFHPRNLSRSSQAKDNGSQPVAETRKPAEDKQSSRRPHGRPVISSDALARVTRNLVRTGPQPTATT